MAEIAVDLGSIDEDGPSPDWMLARYKAGLRFVILRAAYGMTLDSMYARYRHELDVLQIPNSPYLLLEPGVATPEAQVDNAIAAVGSFNPRYFPLALDVEGSRNGLTPTQWRDFVVAANARVIKRLGVPALLYSSAEYWADPDGMNGLPAPELANCLGWWKFYPWPTRSPAVYDPAVVDRLAAPPTPTPWNGAWGIEQYAGDAVNFPGFRSTVDTDRINVIARGQRNASVGWVQRRLPGIAIDDDFGPATDGAVRLFQNEKGVAADGIVGLDTMQLLAWQAPR